MMSIFIAIQVIFAAINLIESQHDYYVIKLQNQNLPDFEGLRKRWKFWSSCYYACIVFMTAFVGDALFDNIWFKILASLALISNRAVFFEIPLNIKLYGWGKMFYVDSTSWFNIKVNEWFKNYVKNVGRFKFVSAILLIVIINIIVQL